ncbi:DUF799 domain-containing protein [Aliamphritea hakodatensis]|uniref:DUF799 domain-containing protein n=1 Tax=Aliamphritea hakodatensis TaxID=2895352 RepID=UPI0022FD5D6A|nr:GNA1162 family protein [Aliamphritea hakodatensis]
MLNHVKLVLLTVAALILAGCNQQQVKYDYAAFENSRPKSILVIPPVNNSIEVNASYIFLSTISRPLAEKGYYVFPVAVIEQFMRNNGLQDPAEMNSIPLDKINEHIGPDAILYVSIENWGQKYEVFDSRTIVDSNWRLIDAKTGQQIWDGTAKGQYSSNDNNQNGLIGMLVGAVINQIAGSVSDNTPMLSQQVNQGTVFNSHNGLLNGPYLKPDTDS